MLSKAEQKALESLKDGYLSVAVYANEPEAKKAAIEWDGRIAEFRGGWRVRSSVPLGWMSAAVSQAFHEWAAEQSDLY